MACRPRAITARHMFVRETFRRAELNMQTKRQKPYNPKSVMKAHGDYFREVSAERKTALCARGSTGSGRRLPGPVRMRLRICWTASRSMCQGQQHSSRCRA